MPKSLLRRPSPAMVVAFVALLVALGGTSFAAFSLPKDSVGTKQLKNDAVTTDKIKDRAVTAAKINTTGLTVPNAVHAKSANKAASAAKATLAASSATTAGYFNSGLVTMTSSSTAPGDQRKLVTRGPFSFIAQCQNKGGGNISGDVLVKDNSATGAIEADFDDNNFSPPTTMNSGNTHGVFDSATVSSAYWYGGSNNNFAVAAPGGPAVNGTGSMGIHVLGADCAFQLVLFG